MTTPKLYTTNQPDKCHPVNATNAYLQHGEVFENTVHHVLVFQLPELRDEGAHVVTQRCPHEVMCICVAIAALEPMPPLVLPRVLAVQQLVQSVKGNMSRYSRA